MDVRCIQSLDQDLNVLNVLTMTYVKNVKSKIFIIIINSSRLVHKKNQINSEKNIGLNLVIGDIEDLDIIMVMDMDLMDMGLMDMDLDHMDLDLMDMDLMDMDLMDLDLMALMLLSKSENFSKILLLKKLSKLFVQLLKMSLVL